MTTRIYIKGDIAVAHQMELYDADTNQQLTTVKQADICCRGGRNTYANLHLFNGAVIRVEVVSAPARVNVTNVANSADVQKALASGALDDTLIRALTGRRRQAEDRVHRVGPCPTCNGTRELIDFNIRKPCPDCKP